MHSVRGGRFSRRLCTGDCERRDDIRKWILPGDEIMRIILELPRIF